jgi:outer membrane lipoprotein-sorting protein
METCPLLPRRRVLALCAAGAAAVAVPARAAAPSASPTASQIVEHVETTLWGRTLQAIFEMTVATPSWARTLVLNVSIERPSKSFVQVTSPAKDAGILSLRLGSEMWNYLPAIERIIKVPPTMMLQPWLGSDFTNDDMVREGSFTSDYTHRLLGERVESGEATLEVELLPKADAAVVWGRVLLLVDRAGLLPLAVRYFNERDELVRTLRYADRRMLDGRSIPTRWEMRPADHPGKHTTIVVKSAAYDRSLPARIFSLQNLGQRR